MKTLVAVPCLDMMHTDFVISLTGMQHDGNIKFVYCQSSLVYDSRNSLARRAVIEGFDRVLWLDSDMKFSSDLLVRLSEDLEGREMVSALYVTRKPPLKPVIYDKLGYDHVEGSKEVKPVASTYYDYPENSVFEVGGCGFGAVLMNTSVIAKIENAYGLPFAPILGFGEDLSFCLRASELGIKMHCDSRLKVGHVGNFVYHPDMYQRGKNAR